MNDNCKTLYEIKVIDVEGDTLLDEDNIIASGEVEAQYKAGVFRILDIYGLELDDVTVIIIPKGFVKIK